MRILTVLLLVLGITAPAQASQWIYGYDAADNPAGDPSSTWAPHLNNSDLHGGPFNRDWTLSGPTLGGVTSSKTFITQAYTFDSGDGAAIPGTNNDVSFGRDSLPLGGTKDNATGASAAFEFWVRPNRTSWADVGNEVIFESGGTVSGTQVALVDGGSDALLRFRTKNGGTASQTIDMTLNDNSLLSDFLHVVAVVDPDAATEKMRLYLNGGPAEGGLKETVNDWQAWQDGNNAAGLGSVAGALGAGGESGDPSFDNFVGDIAIMNVYDGPLTDAEVAGLYNGIPIPEPAAGILLLLGIVAGAAYRRRNRR